MRPELAIEVVVIISRAPLTEMGKETIETEKEMVEISESGIREVVALVLEAEPMGTETCRSREARAEPDTENSKSVIATPDNETPTLM
jgi:hypothetical protein